MTYNVLSGTLSLYTTTAIVIIITIITTRWYLTCYYKKLITRWDGERELFYDDIVHVLSTAKYKTYCPTEWKFAKIFYLCKIRLAVEFENNNE